MELHAFLQHIEGDRIVERALRADYPSPSVGHILEASYLVVEQSSVDAVIAAPASILSRLWAWLSGAGQSAKVTHGTSPAPGTTLRLRTPFDPEGRDALALFAGHAPSITPDDTTRSGIRAASGRAVPLDGSDEILFDDFWLDNDGWRVSQGRDFAIVTQDRQAVIVSCGLAPLIVAPPKRLLVADHQARWCAGLQRLSAPPARGASGWNVTLRAGDEVQVRGVVRPLRESQRSFQVDDGSYRSIPVRPTHVLGDEDGTRLIMLVHRS